MTMVFLFQYSVEGSKLYGINNYSKLPLSFQIVAANNVDNHFHQRLVELFGLHTITIPGQDKFKQQKVKSKTKRKAIPLSMSYRCHFTIKIMRLP